jgi:hypothetical protein
MTFLPTGDRVMADPQQLILYQTADGKTRVEVRLQDESVWLSQAQMAQLFDTTKQNIGIHIKNILDEAELGEEATVKDYFTVRKEGNREVSRKIAHYSQKELESPRRSRNRDA